MMHTLKKLAALTAFGLAIAVAGDASAAPQFDRVDNVHGNPNQAVALKSVTSKAVGIVQGYSAPATVTLSGPAPAGGATVMLQSSSSLGSIPASVFVPEGQTEASFTITANSVTSNTVISISGTYVETHSMNIKIMPR
jgi:hypothetical protein